MTPFNTWQQVMVRTEAARAGDAPRRLLSRHARRRGRHARH